MIWCLLEILETTRAFEELADLVEDAFDVGVVVVHPSDWGAVRGGAFEGVQGGDGDDSLSVILDSVLSPSEDMMAKRLWIGTVHRIPRR